MFSYPTPFTPPTTEDDKLSWLRLIRSRKVGAATFHRLIADHGSAQAALRALPEIARTSGLADYQACSEIAAKTELLAGERIGATLLCANDPAYPADLAAVTDAPPVLWARGRTDLLSRPMVAIVGARNASSLGTRMARRLAEGLSEAGIVVVSGMARGIDTVAHEAALRHGTIAVMAGGVDIIYPAENAHLSGQIAESGLILSEQPPGLDPVARHFPMRNRIISGLCKAVVVVEAAVQSGSLISARLALEQGREVFAVPGHPFDGRAGGCNLLIRDGATLIRGPEDVLDAIGAARAADTRTPQKTDAPAATPPRKTYIPAALEAAILAKLGPSPIAEDQLCRDLAIQAADAAEQLLSLELSGRILRAPGGLISRV